MQFANSDVIDNNQLKIQVERKNDEYTIKELTPIKFKGKVPEQNSAFAQIFNPEIEGQELFSISCDLERAYNNSVFYYFYEGQIDNEENPLAIEGQDDDEENSESE